MSENVFIVVLILANLPVYLVLGKIFFGDVEGFFESVRFWLTPDILSVFSGEYSEDRWATLKLLVFVAACAFAVWSEHQLLAPRFVRAPAPVSAPAR